MVIMIDLCVNFLTLQPIVNFDHICFAIGVYHASLEYVGTLHIVVPALVGSKSVMAAAL